MSDRASVKNRAALRPFNSTKLNYKDSINAVEWLMHSIENPGEEIKRMGTNFPHVRYIDMMKEGCFGLCGKKSPASVLLEQFIK